MSITAFYTGANAQAVESAVTTPLEQVVNGVEGMTYIQSSSTKSGVCTINVYFEIERDPDLAAADVQNPVNQVLGRPPADVPTTGVTVTKNTAGFMGGLGLVSLFIPLGDLVPGYANTTLLDRPYVQMILYLPLTLLAGFGLAGL